MKEITYRIVERKSLFNIEILTYERHWLFFWKKKQVWREVTKWGGSYQYWMPASFANNNYSTLEAAGQQIKEWNTDYPKTIHEP